MKKVYVFIGNYGSGKTELAYNFAFRAAKSGKTELIDLDMINSYFRLSEQKELIKNAGIRLVSPNFVSTGIESLSLPAEVLSAFHSDWDTVVFDLGGDSVGATALGVYRPHFAKLPEGSLEVLYVVNLRRPLSGTVDRIIRLMSELENSSRLKVTGLVNNTNLSVETSENELRDGFFALREVSLKLGIPVAYTTGRTDMLKAFLAEGHDPKFIGEAMEIVTYTHRDWDSFVKHGI